MVPDGDGVIAGPTELKLGASASDDRRSEVLTDGVIRRLPDPISKEGHFAQMILWAHDDPRYFGVLAAMDLDVAAILKAVGTLFSS